MTDEKFFFSTEKLSVGYNGKPLITDITVGLKKGEILTLIGPNGSGKSTILKSITRQLTALGGVVSIDKSDIHKLPPKKLAKQLALVLTERIRPELMTVGDLVSAGRYPYTNYFGRLTQHDKEVVRDSLERVHAADLYDRDFSSLSDGQRQRVMLARAICQEPEIIVLDEPTSFLDIRHKIELLDILRDMAKNRGITVIMSLHEIDLAYKISDRVMCVKGDKINALGKPEEIFSDEKIAELYSLTKGGYDTLLGSVELASPEDKGGIDVFVIGGNGCGVPYYRILQRYNVPFAAGILFENDVDYRVAKKLAGTVISAPPFSPPDDDIIEKAEKNLDKCRFAVDSGCPIGIINKANEILLEKAKSGGKKIISSLDDVTEVFGK